MTLKDLWNRLDIIAVLGFLIAVEQQITGGSMSFAHTLPEAWIPVVKEWAANLASIGGLMVGILRVAGNGMSPSSITPTIVKVLLAAFALSFLLAGGSPVHAQTRPLKLTGDVAKDLGITKPMASGDDAMAADKAMGSFGSEIRKITKQLVDKAIADVQAASDDAAKHNDLIAKPCWDANLKLLQGLPSQWETPPADIGLALGIQIQRDLLNSITGNDPTSLKVACAALWGDQIKIVANVGALLGIRIATGGLF